MGMTMIAMPMMAGTSGLIMALSNIDRPLFAMVGLFMLVGAVALGGIMFVSMRLGPRRKLRDQRERYLDYLDDMRSLIRDAVRAQQDAAAARHPHTPLLAAIAGGDDRRWERRSGDRDLLDLRVGLARLPLSRTLTLKLDENNPLTGYDPVCHSGAEELVRRYVRLGGQPLTVPLAGCDRVSVVGDFEDGRHLVRGMLAQLVTLVSPDDAAVAIVRDPRAAAHWRWASFLPHTLGDQQSHSGLPDSLVCDNTDMLTARLATDIAGRQSDWRRRRGGPPGPGTRHLVVVIDGEHQVSLPGFADGAIPPAELGIHIVSLVDRAEAEPEDVDVRLTIASDGAVTLSRPRRVVAAGTDSGEVTGVADGLGIAEAAGIARALSPYRLAESDSGEALHAVHGLGDVLGVQDPAAFDPWAAWSRRDTERLRVPFAVSADGEPVELDLKESALGGMGPHGLIIGATGSGKSETLRTLVAALATRHSPEELALLTVDFKGGATFADCDRLPHNAGSITNLADDLALVDRFREALFGEMVRRQQLLKDVGNLPNVHAYQRLRAQRPDLAALPHLLVVIDEFSELLTAKPDFSELFLAVGRIGRSIGVHLLLATQRLEAGHIRGLESHLSYRIGLRTFSEAESREAIGVPDAYRLPPEPGSGYLKVDTSVFTRFKAAMVSDPYVPPATGGHDGLPVMEWPPPPFDASDVSALLRLGDDTGADSAEATSARTVLQVLVDRIAAADPPPVRPVWLPPLPNALPLDAVPGGTEAAGDPARVSAVLGLSDDPRAQSQEAMHWDMTGSQANLLVYGGPGSGKSTLLRTLVSSLALRYSPGQVSCYLIDYGGGSLAGLANLPHVAAVANRSDPELVRRVLADVRRQLDLREGLMQRHGLDSAARLRAARAEGVIPSDVAGDVVLLIDGWAALRENDLELDEQLRDITGRGPALGVHVVLTAVNQQQVRTRLSAAFGGHIELRLTDAFDSVIGRRLAENLPKDVPGRVLCADERFGQVALPRIDGGTRVDDLNHAGDEIAETAARRWPVAPVPKVKTLPTLITLADLQSDWVEGPRADVHAMRPVLGVSERDLGPVCATLDTEPHLMIYGDPQTGKSTAIRTILRQITRRPANEVGIVLVDYRRAHLEEVPQKYLLSYCTSAPHAAQNAAEIANGLRERLPGPDVTPEQLRRRSWWKGLEVFVVVDDYDLVASGNGNPLLPLAEFIPQGRDLGFHMIVARRTGGASRAVYEKVLQAIGEQSPPGLLFSGDRMEGRLSNGVASQRLPVGRALLTHRGESPQLVQVALS
ncbi:S-DNA-T family DNA segregation ATPase FtsK/SpoIIIE [Stackebrandtia albiflava]|uniref:S-DNA-T family DNA segregation ATPase FtsK/SpoIIIE n=2 Tax=Stackebrandtia albiflava TaxID=406432 RepID=A0A562UY18_9ACTN|nr:S-DNA-T family DNA segregation ATPase FtsK/SpoIIIE [Stackebrandtia albiflava]